MTHDRASFIQLDNIDLDRFQPCAGRMLVLRDPPRTMHGKLHVIAKDANDRRFETTTGRVVRLGAPAVSESKGTRVPWTVREGDRVLLARFAGHDAVINGDDRYNMMTEADVLAVIGDDVQLD